MLKASQKDRLLVDHHQTLHVVEAARDLPADCLDSRALQPLLLVFRLDRMPELAGDRLDQELADQGRLADPEMPVTLVMTPSGMSTSSRFRLLRVTPRRRSQPFGARNAPDGASASAKRCLLVSDTAILRSPSGGPL
jgi:hypothetical protein